MIELSTCLLAAYLQNLCGLTQFSGLTESQAARNTSKLGVNCYQSYMSRREVMYNSISKIICS